MSCLYESIKLLPFSFESVHVKFSVKSNQKLSNHAVLETPVPNHDLHLSHILSRLLREARPRLCASAQAA